MGYAFWSQDLTWREKLRMFTVFGFFGLVLALALVVSPVAVVGVLALVHVGSGSVFNLALWVACGFVMAFILFMGLGGWVGLG